MTFEELDLDPKLLQATQDAGFTACTPVQEQTFVYSLIGADVAVQSQTGTGKTAAFLITIFQLFLEQRSLDDSIALIVAPTRELADQIEMDALQLGKHLDFSIASFYGGVGYEKQERALAGALRVAIGTPGRLLDFAKQRKLDLSRVGILVIDEADRLFDMGFIPDLRRLIRQMPGRDERITMLYSATLTTRVKSLAWEYMQNPAEISITPERVTVDEISQELYHVPRERKLSLLLGILGRDEPRNALIFTNTKQVAYEVATRMQRNGLACEYIIGDLPQSKRQRLIDELKAGDLQYLVATDVAARGLHVEELDLVVNYDLPEYSENYVHRVGRTARAGRSGKAVALACEEYVFALEGIEEFIRMPISAVTASAEMYVEDASAGMRVGHYMGQRSRDDRRGRNGGRGGSQVASRSPGSGARRAPALAAAAVNGGGPEPAEAAAARERTAEPGDGPGAAPVSAAPATSGSRAARGQGGTARGASTSDGQRRPRAAEPREAGSRSRGTRSAGGGRNSTGPRSPSGTAKDVARSRHTGDGDESSRRRQGDPGGAGPSRSHTTEQRLAYYREKYGEDFKLADEPAPVSPGNSTAVSENGDGQPAAGLRGLLPRLFRRRTRQGST
jgi:ATP-dependent RNA helicase RhlB